MTFSARIASVAQRDVFLIIGIVLSALWLLLMLIFWWLVPAGEGQVSGLPRLISIFGAIAPLVLIWIGVALIRAIAELRAEANDLRQHMAQLRNIAATRGAPPPLHPSDTATRPAPPAAAPVTYAPTTTATRPHQPIRQPDSRQAAMRFDSPNLIDVPMDTLIHALNFPDGADDAAGISALRTALKDQNNSRVIRAAQDVVTLLAGQDIYMDVLTPQPISVQAWYDFAQGDRGEAVAAVGGIHDEAVLEVTNHLLRNDEVFRDTAHHFMRQFDVMLGRIVPQLDEEQIVTLANTRSARAFMVLGRIAGIFG